MSRRSAWLLVLVAIVAALNLWRWWPAAAPASSDPREWTGQGITEALRVKVAVDTQAVPPLRRDLFQPPRARAPVQAPPKVEAPPAGPPPKAPEELAREAAQAELEQIKLVGVVIRDGTGEAFFVKGERAYIAQEGGKVGRRFMVESVTAEGVLLRDPATDVSGSIPVSGK